MNWGDPIRSDLFQLMSDEIGKTTESIFNGGNIPKLLPKEYSPYFSDFTHTSLQHAFLAFRKFNYIQSKKFSTRLLDFIRFTFCYNQIIKKGDLKLNR